MSNIYDSLQKTIVILITNFCVKGLEDLEYHTSWEIIEEKYRKIILINKLDFHIIELPKIMEGSHENDNLLDWLVEWREKAIYEYNTATNTGVKNGMKRGLEEGLEQGIEQGLKKGAKKEKFSIATKLLKQRL